MFGLEKSNIVTFRQRQGTIDMGDKPMQRIWKETIGYREIELNRGKMGLENRGKDENGVHKDNIDRD